MDGWQVYIIIRDVESAVNSSSIAVNSKAFDSTNPITYLPDFAIPASVIAKMLLPIVLLLLPAVFGAVNSRSVAVNSGFIAVQKYNIMHS